MGSLTRSHLFLYPYIFLVRGGTVVRALLQSIRDKCPPETAVARSYAPLHTHTRHAQSAHRILPARPVEYRALALEAALHILRTRKGEENLEYSTLLARRLELQERSHTMGATFSALRMWCMHQWSWVTIKMAPLILKLPAGKPTDPATCPTPPDYNISDFWAAKPGKVCAHHNVLFCCVVGKPPHLV